MNINHFLPHFGTHRNANAIEQSRRYAPLVPTTEPCLSPRFLPWLDRSGRFSPLKAATFAALFLPGLWAIAALLLGKVGAEPAKETLRYLGDWTVRLLLLALLVTPLRQLGRWPRLMLIRRMLGIGAFAYIVIHFALYIADQAFDLRKVASEIVLRVYLTIGFVALVGLAALAATSTDRMVRRLGGRNWQRLHYAAYPLTALALIHFLLQRKGDITEAILMIGLFFWLMGYRAIEARRGRPGLWWSLALALGAALATAAAEGLWYGLATGIDPWRVLEANLDPLFSLRPAWWVAIAGLGMALIGLARTQRSARPAGVAA